MTVNQMREFLAGCYHAADKWVKRVEAMSDNQIIAIYYRMLRTEKTKAGS